MDFRRQSIRCNSFRSVNWCRGNKFKPYRSCYWQKRSSSEPPRSKRKSEEHNLIFDGTALSRLFVLFDSIIKTCYAIYYNLLSGIKKNVVKKKEHIVLVQEPGSKYMGHTTPKSGNSTNIANSLKDHFKGREWKSIKALGWAVKDLHEVLWS